MKFVCNDKELIKYAEKEKLDIVNLEGK